MPAPDAIGGETPSKPAALPRRPAIPGPSREVPLASQHVLPRAWRPAGAGHASAPLTHPAAGPAGRQVLPCAQELGGVQGTAASLGLRRLHARDLARPKAGMALRDASRSVRDATDDWPGAKSGATA